MFRNLIQHAKFLILWGVVFALSALLVSLVLPKYYSSQSDVLITTYRGGSDPYTQAKSAERLGEDLAQIMGTTDFYKKVMDSAGQFDKSYWAGLSERKQRKTWNKNVQAGMQYGTSLLHITTYAKSKTETLELSKAVVATLVARGWEYVGSDVSIKPVNDSLVSVLPARPNFVVNFVVAFVLGVAVSGWWVVRYK